MFTGINQQHLADALGALLLQQRIELLAAAAEVGVGAVAQGDDAVVNVG
jgi:hypothetical protein